MDPFSMAALIAGGASLIGTSANIAANTKLNKANRKWQEKMWQKTNERQEYMYNLYNSPQAQARQYMAAGMNPGLFNSSSSGSAQVSSSVPTPASVPYDIGGIGDAGQVVANSLQARESLKHQKDVLKQQTISDFRNFIISLEELDLTEQQTRALVESKQKEMEKLGVEKDILDITYQMYKDFYDSGGNTYSDESRVKQTQAIDNLVNSMRVVNDDARARDLHPFNLKRADLENKSLDQIYNMQEIRYNLAPLGIDFESLPPYLKGAALYLSLLRSGYYAGKISYDDYQSAFTEFEKDFDKYKTSSVNSDDPNYQSDMAKSMYLLDFWDSMNFLDDLFD